MALKVDTTLGKLTHTNWNTWSFQFECFLGAKKMKDALTDEFDKNSDQALSFLGLHIDESFIPNIKKYDNLKEAWDYLTDLFAKPTTARVFDIKRSLNSLKMEGGENVSQYFARGMRLSSDYTSAGYNMEENELVMNLLNGLPDRFELVREIILATKDHKTITCDSVLGDLIKAEHKFTSQEAEAAEAKALLGFGGNKGGNKSGGFRGGRGGGGGGDKPRFDSAPGANGRKKFLGICHYCKKPGHMIADCYKLKAKQATAAGGSSSTPGAVALMAGIAPKAWEPGCNRWFIDSGSTFHISPSSAFMIDYTPIEPIPIIMPDGTSKMAVGKGSLYLTVYVAGCDQLIWLDTVMHVPDFTHNLFSVKCAVAHGAEVKFDGFHAKVTKGDNILVVAHIKTNADLFTFYGERFDFAPYVPPSDRMAYALHAAASNTKGAQLWHQRFGHLGFSNISKLIKGNMVTGIPNISATVLDEAATSVCEPCVLGKQARKPFKSSKTETKQPLEVVHMDLFGPISVKSMGGNYYGGTLTDGHTDFHEVICVPSKSDIKGAVKRVLNKWENLTGFKTKFVRTDRGGEYVNKELSDWFEGRGIIHQKTAPYTPEQNGVAERYNRTLWEKARSMMQAAGVKKSLWAEAISTANYLTNISPASGSSLTPFERFYGRKPDVSHLRVFGCRAYAHIPKELRRKIDPVSEPGIFIGYAADSKAYRLLLDDGRIVERRDVTFDESKFGSTPTTFQVSDTTDGFVWSIDTEFASADPEPFFVFDNPAAAAAHIDVAEEEEEAPPAPLSPVIHIPVPIVSAINNNNVLAAPAAADAAPRRNPPRNTDPNWQQNEYATVQEKAKTAGNALAAVVSALTDVLSDEPTSFKEAVSRPDGELWKAAADSEMASLLANNTWELVELPPGAKPITAKWVFKIKRGPNGEVERYKARLVARGFEQREGVDYQEVFAPTSKQATLRALLSLAAVNDLEVVHLDVKTAFLNGDLEEEIYMVQPEGYEEGGRNIVCRLRKALYGLKQAPRAWHDRLKSELDVLGFTPSIADPSFYICKGQVPIYLLAYVDDLIIVSADSKLIETKVSALQSKFDLRNLGPASYFIGIEITRDRNKKLIKIDQKRMTRELVRNYGLADAKPKTTPLSPAVKLVKQGKPLDKERFGYSNLIGSLLYISVCTRPDIAQAVGALARYMSNPMEEHWEAARGVVRYLASTSDYGICFGPKTTGLYGYTDSDHAGDIDTRRSTTGYVYMFNGGAISWSSRLQQTVAASTTEAEYMAASAATKEALWLSKLFSDLGFDTKPVLIYCDNQATISLIRNPVTSARSKHIDIIYHFARERALRNEVRFVYCITNNNLADIFTKALPDIKFVFCRTGMGLM